MTTHPIPKQHSLCLSRLNQERVLFVMQTKRPAFVYDSHREAFVSDDQSASIAPGTGLTFMQVGGCVHISVCVQPCMCESFWACVGVCPHVHVCMRAACARGCVRVSFVCIVGLVSWVHLECYNMQCCANHAAAQMAWSCWAPTKQQCI
jgi:hypothetical protein